MKDRSIGIVLINYFNDAEVIAFIKTQLAKQSDQSFRIYLLNNGSNNSEALKKLCEQESRIVFFDSGSNLGYIGGFLYVFSKLEVRPELIILSNTDLVIDDAHFFEKLSDVETGEDVVMMGPSVFSSRTGHNQNPFYATRISSGKLKFLSVVFSNYFLYFLYQLLGLAKGIFKSKTQSENSFPAKIVYALHGSFMVFKSAFLEKYFEELKDAPFLFGEELQFAEVAAGHQKKTLFLPALKLIHHEHATTKLFKSGKMLHHLKESIDFRLRKRVGK